MALCGVVVVPAQQRCAKSSLRRHVTAHAHVMFWFVLQVVDNEQIGVELSKSGTRSGSGGLLQTLTSCPPRTLSASALYDGCWSSDPVSPHLPTFPPQLRYHESSSH